MNRLIGATLALAVLVLAVFLFFKYQQANLEQRRFEISNEMLLLESSELKKEEAKLINLSKKIKEFSRVFQEHELVSELFFYLKKDCHSQAQFESLNFDIETHQARIKGITSNFKTLGEQLLVLENSENIKDFQLNEISLSDEGRVNFEIIFSLNQAIFKL